MLKPCWFFHTALVWYLVSLLLTVFGSGVCLAGTPKVRAKLATSAPCGTSASNERTYVNIGSAVSAKRAICASIYISMI